MDTAKKKKRRNIIFAASAVLVAGALVALPFILDARQKSLDNTASVLSAPVTVGTIRKTLSGTGTLAEEDAQEVSVPQGVEVTEYLVENGQYVKAGDLVATVDKVSVMETISTLREAMADVETEMDTIGSGFDFKTISSSAPGRVKAVYAKKGEAVKDVIARDGALAVISLDGMMSVQFRPLSILFVGQTVSVELSDGKQVNGRVDTIVDGEVTVTISDEYGDIGEQARIVGDDGQELGSGTLSIHSPMRIIEADGTVDTVYITKDKKVSAYSYLFVLSGTSASGSYQALASEHRKYEDILARLFVMYQNGVLSAPCDGCVSGVDKNILKQLSASDGDTPVLKLLSANAPPNKEEATFANVIGMVTDTKTGTAMLQKWQTEIPDYSDTSFIVTATDSFTKQYSYSAVPVYVWNATETEQDVYSEFEGEAFEDGVNYYEKASDGTYTRTTDIEKSTEKTYYYISGTETIPGGEWKTGSAAVKGIYAFAFDGSDNLVWMVYIGTGDKLPETGGRPDQQGSGDKPDSGGTGNMPGAGNGMTGGAGGIGGGDFGGTAAQVENERFSTAETTILSVTPQDTVSLEITVDELDILSIREGQQAEVMLDALMGQAFTGTITGVNTTSTNEGGNSKYTAEVELPRTAYMLGGMNASVNITVEERENVLLIPSAALTEQDGKPAVYTAWDSHSEELQNLTVIETGLSDGQQVQVLSGLSEWELVWYRYYDKLESNGLPG